MQRNWRRKTIPPLTAPTITGTRFDEVPCGQDADPPPALLHRHTGATDEATRSRTATTCPQPPSPRWDSHGPPHQQQLSSRAAAIGDGDLDDNCLRLWSTAIVLLLHGALLVTIQAAATATESLVRFGHCVRQGAANVYSQRNQPGPPRRHRAAIMVGRSRMRRRGRHRGGPRDRIRAWCRRAEAAWLIYLLVSTHCIRQTGGGNPRTQGAEGRQGAYGEGEGRHGVASAAAADGSTGRMTDDHGDERCQLHDPPD